MKNFNESNYSPDSNKENFNNSSHTQNTNLEFQKNKTVRWKIINQEIKNENIRILILNIISWIVFLVSLTLFFFCIFKRKKLLEFSSFLDYWFLIPLLFFACWMVVITSMGAYSFRQEKKIHFNNGELNIDRLPFFVLNTYKRCFAIRIFMNWLAFVIYVLGSIAITILFWIKGEENPSFKIGALKIEIEETFPSFLIELILLFVVVGAMFFLHIFIFIYTGQKKAKLNSVFDIENKIDKKDLNSYKNKVQFVCAAIFLIPFFLVWVFYRFFWKKKK